MWIAQLRRGRGRARDAEVLRRRSGVDPGGDVARRTEAAPGGGQLAARDDPRRGVDHRVAVDEHRSRAQQVVHEQDVTEIEAAAVVVVAVVTGGVARVAGADGLGLVVDLQVAHGHRAVAPGRALGFGHQVEGEPAFAGGFLDADPVDGTVFVQVHVVDAGGQIVDEALELVDGRDLLGLEGVDDQAQVQVVGVEQEALALGFDRDSRPGRVLEAARSVLVAVTAAGQDGQETGEQRTHWE